VGVPVLRGAGIATLRLLRGARRPPSMLPAVMLVSASWVLLLEHCGRGGRRFPGARLPGRRWTRRARRSRAADGLPLRRRRRSKLGGGCGLGGFSAIAADRRAAGLRGRAPFFHRHGSGLGVEDLRGSIIHHGVRADHCGSACCEGATRHGGHHDGRASRHGTLIVRRPGTDSQGERGSGGVRSSRPALATTHCMRTAPEASQAAPSVAASPRGKGDPGSATCCALGSEKLQNEAFQIGFQTETSQPKRGTKEAARGLGYARA
jgi:hypothetical protein